jgi:hypothetical protein
MSVDAHNSRVFARSRIMSKVETIKSNSAPEAPDMLRAALAEAIAAAEETERALEASKGAMVRMNSLVDEAGVKFEGAEDDSGDELLAALAAQVKLEAEHSRAEAAHRRAIEHVQAAANEILKSHAPRLVCEAEALQAQLVSARPVLRHLMENGLLGAADLAVVQGLLGSSLPAPKSLAPTKTNSPIVEFCLDPTNFNAGQKAAGEQVEAMA